MVNWPKTKPVVDLYADPKMLAIISVNIALGWSFGAAITQDTQLGIKCFPSGETWIAQDIFIILGYSLSLLAFSKFPNFQNIWIFDK